MIRLLVVSALFGLVLSDGKTCGKCLPTPKLYEELRCVGVLDSDGCCFERFDCPDLTSLPSDKCHYKGRSYNLGEQLEYSETPSCSPYCYCAEEYPDKKEAFFRCLHVDCPEFFGWYKFNGCVLQYSLNGCCSINKVCGEDKIKELAKCELQGKTYIEGQQMYPERSCHSCLCTKDFNSSIPIEWNNNCEKMDCGIELFNFNELRSGCVPIYIGSNSCCPALDLRCPSDEDEVMPIEGRADLDVVPEKTCKYGNHTLHIGQKLNSLNKCVECICKQPPIVECIKKIDC